MSAGDLGQSKSRHPRGDGQVALLAGYGLLAFAAAGRSIYELVAKFSEAPLEYSLSTVAALIYLAAVWAIARGDDLGLKIATAACSFELAGVLAVGTWTLVDDSEFSQATVWTYYGRDYGWLPLVMPFLALLWIARRYRARPT